MNKPDYHKEGTDSWPIPLGHFILVEADTVEEKSEGGILLYTSQNELKRQQGGMNTGTVRAMGNTVFTGYEWSDSCSTGEAERWGVAIGDRVEFERYEGKACFVEGYENFHYIPDGRIIGKCGGEA